jgi:protein-tyrosine kinase
MSIIESAMQKARLLGEGGSKTNQREQRRDSGYGAHTETVAQPRKFQQATIDSVTMERNCILPETRDGSALRAYKILRTRVLQRLATGQWCSLAVTGIDSAQGKTLTAINLATALAQDPNTSVFLVDLDLHRPQIGAYLGMKFNLGLSDYLMGKAEVDQIIYSTGTDRLAVIPSSQGMENSSEYLGAPRMLELVRRLKDESPRHVIVYDMPPLLLSDDVLTFVPNVDTVLLVVSEGVTNRRALEKAKEYLAEMNLIGVVLNRSAERNDSAYY